MIHIPAPKKVVGVRAPTSLEDLEAAKALFLEYAESLGFSLCFQGFDEEMAGFPGVYAPPRGALLLARVDDQPAAVVGLRPFADEGACEMKRLYVRPEHRCLGLGRQLATGIVICAKERGFKRMVLDTLERMTPARSLYRSLGFYERPPYYENPLTGVVYMEKVL